MINLPDVTLIGVDCVDIERLILACNISTKEIQFGQVKLLSSIGTSDPRVIKIDPLLSPEAYSDFMIKELWKYIDTPFAIIFQYDGFILNSSAWRDEFLNYDYIGAPWYHLGDLHVGNGGFSLRSKKLVTWLADNYNRVDAKIHPEDVFISRFARPLLEKEGMIFADEKTASLFSKEGSERSVVWNGEFGFHGIKYTDISRWKDVHPDYGEKLNYKLDDYCMLMRKYPTYDGTVHTLRFNKYNLKNYKALSEGKKNYEVRITNGKYEDMTRIKEGDTVVFKRSGVPFEKFPVPAFEKKVAKIENFQTKGELHMKYPSLIIHPLRHKLPAWKRVLSYIASDYFCADAPYTIVWF
jgi:ASC-1-like (ASCH) protein